LISSRINTRRKRWIISTHTPRQIRPVGERVEAIFHWEWIVEIELCPTTLKATAITLSPEH